MKADQITELAPFHYLVKVEKDPITSSIEGFERAEAWEGGRNLSNEPQGVIIKAAAPCVYRDEEGNQYQTGFYKEGEKVAWKRNCERQFWEEDKDFYSVIHVKNFIAKLK